MMHHELKLFLSVAEHLHFGKASRACNLSASALTRSIQRLEEELGQKLFVRDNRTVEITEAGLTFKKYALQAVYDWQSVREDLEEKELVYGDLTIYSSLTAVYTVLPELISNFSRDFPEVKVGLRTGAAEDAIDKVMEGEIDLAVAALTDRPVKGVEFLPLLVTNLSFVIAKSPTLANSGSSWLEMPLVLPEKGVSRVRVDQWLKQQGEGKKQIMEVSGNEAILAMVRLGCGVGVVPEIVLENSPFSKEIEVIETGGILEAYKVGLCSTKKNLEKTSVSVFWERARLKSEKLS